MDGSGADPKVHQGSNGEEKMIKGEPGGMQGEKMYRVAWIRSGVGVLAVLLCASVGLGAEPARWQVDWQRAIEGAKKEGQLSLYGGLEITHPDIIAAFNKEFPFIKITSASGRAADMVTRIVAERRADKYLADVTASGPNGPRTLYLGKMLDPIAPALILPEVADTSKWYGGKHWYADPENKHIFMFEGTIVTSGLSYNTKMMRADEIKSYWDMLNPKWKGKLLAQDPRGAALLTPVLILYHRPGVGPEFVRRLYAETDITLFRDRRQGTNWLATGKFPLCHLCREIDKAAQQGLPVDEIAPEKLKEGGTIGGGGSSVLALINRAPHPNAAKVFINWYLSREGQSMWQKVMNLKEVEVSDSMRIDIPKDDVLPDGRRAAGREYQVIGFLDPEPVQKLLNEVLK
jgi:ABC-type Fe3+ transport system substrate-binding protein